MSCWFQYPENRNITGYFKDCCVRNSSSLSRQISLSEYEEIVSKKYSPPVARNVVRALLLLPNVVRTEVYYNWGLIQNDRDDDKFVDCAIASNADAIVTHDKHFNILSAIPFPQIRTLTVSEFEAVLGKQREDS